MLRMAILASLSLGFLLLPSTSLGYNVFECTGDSMMMIFYGQAKYQCTDANNHSFLIETQTGGIAFNMLDGQFMTKAKFVFEGQGDGVGSFWGVSAGVGFVYGIHGFAGGSTAGGLRGGSHGVSALGHLGVRHVKTVRMSGTFPGETVNTVARLICQQKEADPLICEQPLEQYLLQADKIIMGR